MHLPMRNISAKDLGLPLFLDRLDFPNVFFWHLAQFSSLISFIFVSSIHHKKISFCLSFQVSQKAMTHFNAHLQPLTCFYESIF